MPVQTATSSDGYIYHRRAYCRIDNQPIHKIDQVAYAPCPSCGIPLPARGGKTRIRMGPDGSLEAKVKARWPQLLFGISASMFPILLIVALILALSALMEVAFTGDVSSGANLAGNIAAVLVVAAWVAAIVGLVAMAVHADTSRQRQNALWGTAAWVAGTAATWFWLSSPQ